jgi:hypothetical protein
MSSAVRTALAGLCVLLLQSWAGAQILDEEPVAAGGDPVGAWEADRTPLQVYAAPAIVSTFNPEFSGIVEGRLQLAPDGTYEADYAVTAGVKIASLLLAVDTSFVETFQETGTFEIDGGNLILTPAAAGGATPGPDTLGFTASGDSLHLIQTVPLGGYGSILESLFPDAGPPVALLGMRRTEGAGGEPEELTADFDGNGRVDFVDFLAFAPQYGKPVGPGGVDARFDLNASGAVDFLDFLELARQYGKAR